jgi:Curli production assembly/transport component CsgG
MTYGPSKDRPSKSVSLLLIALCLLPTLLPARASAQTKPRSKPAEAKSQPAEKSKPAQANETAASHSSKKVVMVPDFDTRGIYHWWPGNWDIGSLFANSTMGPLSRSQGYEVVERGRTRDVIAEQVTSESERFNQPAITKAGRLLGADYILFGDLLDFSRKKGGNMFVKEVQVSIRLSARLVSVATGKVYRASELTYLSPKSKEYPFKSEQETNPNDPEFLQSLFGKAITEASAQMVSQLIGEGEGGGAVAATGGGSPSPQTPGGGKSFVEQAAAAAEKGLIADVTGNTVVINVGSSQGAKPGMLFAVVRVVKEVRDPGDPTKIIMRKTEELARIKLTTVERAASEGTLVSGKADNLKVGAEVVRVN